MKDKKSYPAPFNNQSTSFLSPLMSSLLANEPGPLTRWFNKRKTQRTIEGIENVSKVDTAIFNAQIKHNNAYMEAVRSDDKARNIYQDIENERKKKAMQDRYEELTLSAKITEAEHTANNILRNLEGEDKIKEMQSQYEANELQRKDEMSQADAELHIKQGVASWAELDNRENQLRQERELDKLPEEERLQKRFENFEKETAMKSKIRNVKIQDKTDEVASIVEGMEGLRERFSGDAGEEAASILKRLFMGGKI